MPSQLPLLPQDPAALRGLIDMATEPMLLLDASLQVRAANAAAQQQLALQIGGELHGLLTATGTKLLDWLRLAVQAHAEGRRLPAAPSVQMHGGSCAHVSLSALEPQDGETARWLLQAQPEAARPARRSRRSAIKAAPPATAEPPHVVQRDPADRAFDEIDQWLALSPQPMLLFEAGGLLLRCNAPFAALLPGSPSSLQELPAALQSLLGWQRGRMLPALQGTQALQTQASLVDPAGRTRWLQAQVQRQAGTSQRYMAVLLDRTAEQERDLAHQQLDALMDTAGVGLATFQQDAGWLRPRATSKSGGGSGASDPLAGLQGVGRDIVEPESLPEFERLQQALKAGERTEVEYAVQHPELGRRWLLTRVEPGTLGSGQRTLSVVTLDVTARHLAQDRNEQLLRELTTIMDSSGLGMAYLRGERLLRCNPGFAQMLALQPRAATAGTPLAELFATLPALGREVIAALPSLDTREGVELEFQPELPPAGAMQRWLSLSLRRVRSALGHETSEPETIAVISDVTTHRAAEAARLEAAIAQRELLVREVHHRIKNNLQGVAGLLQQIAARRPEVADVINEAVGQVQAIAQVYGLQVGSTGPVRLRRVLEAITGSVQRIFGRGVHLAVAGPQAEQAHQWSLPEAEAIPIALSLNELLTNAVKHGVGDGVQCTLVCEADHVLVEIRNRGALPPGFDLGSVRGGVSGLGLVRALLPRRSATLSLYQLGGEVVCRVELRPPGLSYLRPL